MSCKNCEGAGAAQAKTGKNRQALDRAAGMSATMNAMGSRTRSGHTGTGQNNKWQAPSLGWGEGNNVKGYGS